MDPLNGDENLSLQPSRGSDVCAHLAGTKFKTSRCTVKRACGVCTINEGNINLWLKGVCQMNREEEEYDIKYYIFGLMNGKMHFR
jgi:hypothetical protein